MLRCYDVDKEKVGMETSKKHVHLSEQRPKTCIHYRENSTEFRFYCKKVLSIERTKMYVGLFAVLTSLTGLTNVLLIFVPFVIAIILLLGYDKLVAISSTIVSMLVGFMGGLYVTFRDPSKY